VNRFRLMPRLRRPETATVPLRTLVRSLLAEQAIGVVVLAGRLGAWYLVAGKHADVRCDDGGIAGKMQRPMAAFGASRLLRPAPGGG